MPTGTKPYTREDFIREVGDEPIMDDLERANCPHAGEIGHWGCGLCAHNRPMFTCSECTAAFFATMRAAGEPRREAHDASTTHEQPDERICPLPVLPASWRSRREGTAVFAMTTLLGERIATIADHLNTHLGYQNLVNDGVWPAKYVPHTVAVARLLEKIEALEAEIGAAFAVPNEEDYAEWWTRKDGSGQRLWGTKKP